MDSCLIKRTYDIDLINSVVMTMFDDIVEDDTHKSCFSVDPVNSCWLSAEANGELCGLFQINAYNRTTLDIHPYILKDKRRYSALCGKAALNWIDREAPEMYKKVVTRVPSIYPHIKKYALSLGFKLEGTITNSYTKNGKQWDLWLFGKPRG